MGAFVWISDQAAFAPRSDRLANLIAGALIPQRSFANACHRRVDSQATGSSRLEAVMNLQRSWRPVSS